MMPSRTQSDGGLHDAVCISGCGAVSPYGQGTQALRDGVARGEVRLAVDEELRDASGLHGRTGRVPASVFEADNSRNRRMPRCNRMALMAAQEALSSSGLDPDDPGESTGIFYCTDHGPESQTCRFLDALYHKSPRLVSPLLFQNTTFAAGAGEISMRHAIRGPSYTVVNGFQSSLTAVSLAMMALRLGRIRQALVVATDELTALQQKNLTALGLARRASADNGQPDGFEPAEGAAALVLEHRSDCESRTHIPLGTVLGVGHGHDAQSARRSDPNGRGLAHALRCLLRAGGTSARIASIDRVWLAENGHPVMDTAERTALHVLANTDGLHWLAHTPHVRIKALIGEAHAATPAMQLVAALTASAPQPPGHAASGIELINALSPGGGAACIAVQRHTGV